MVGGHGGCDSRWRVFKPTSPQIYTRELLLCVADHVVLFEIISRLCYWGVNITSEHSYQFMDDKKKGYRIYTVLSKNDSHKSAYNCVNIQVCYSNHINLH